MDIFCHYLSRRRFKKRLIVISILCFISCITIFESKTANVLQKIAGKLEHRLTAAIISATYSEKNKIVYILLVAEKYYSLKFNCFSRNDTATSVHSVEAYPVIHINRCEWRAFVAQCNVVDNIKELEIETSFNEKSIVPIRKPSSKQYDVVVCLTPLYLFERWPLLVTAAEVWKANGVDLLQVYIMHVMAHTMELLRLYEKSGFVNLLPWSSLPSDGSFDPNRELEWRNEPAALTDCLFLHRDSAKYIIFANPDNILLPDGKNSLKNEFDQRLLNSPDASAFVYHNRDVSILYEEATFTMGNFSFHRFFKNTVVDLCTDKTQTKFVGIPSRLLGVWLHNTDTRTSSAFRDVHVSCSDNSFLHLSNWYNTETFQRQRRKEPFYLRNIIDEAVINTTQLQKSFIRLIGGINDDMILQQNGHEVYMPAINECYAKRDIYPMAKYCPGPHFCDIPHNDNPCYVSNATYNFIKDQKSHSISIQYSSTINLRQTGCL